MLSTSREIFLKESINKPIGLSIDPGDRLLNQALASSFNEKGKF
jgi:hypothetical protein